MNFYKHHIGDYAQATGHLSFVEDAAYSRMLRKYYAEEKPLPHDVKAVQRLVGARSKDERDAVQAVLEEFFTLLEDGWHNKRADAELAKANAQAETNRRIAEEREARRKARSTVDEPTTNHGSAENESLNESSTAAVASREPSQTPDTRHQTEAKLPRGARGTRLPPDWDPGESGFAFAASQGLTNGAAKAEAEKFRDHWAAKTGQDASKADWQAAWRNWVRKAIEFRPKGAGALGDEPWAGAH